MFKIGDKVKAIKCVDELDLIGMEGVVCNIQEGKELSIGVNFGKFFGQGHTCDNTCPSGFGRYGKECEFELIEPIDKPLTVKGGEMETELKNFSPSNLAQAKKLAEEELSLTEINTAKAVYLDLAKKKKEQENKIKDANKEIKELDKQLNVFRVK